MSDTLMISVSGVRGLVGTDLTPEVVARWAAAFGTWAGEGKRPSGRRATRPSIVLGRDARTSGPMFAAAATAGPPTLGGGGIEKGLVATPTAQPAGGLTRARGGVRLHANQ